MGYDLSLVKATHLDLIAKSRGYDFTNSLATLRLAASK
jgi:hypothetical protein